MQSLGNVNISLLSYRSIVDLGISKFSYIVLAILMLFKDNFACNYRKIRNRNLANVML